MTAAYVLSNPPSCDCRDKGPDWLLISCGGVRKNYVGVHSTPPERVARLGGWYGRGVSLLSLGVWGATPGKFFKFVCKMVASESHFQHILTYSDTGNCTQLEFFIFI